MKNILYMIKENHAKLLFFIITAACLAAILTVCIVGGMPRDEQVSPLRDLAVTLADADGVVFKTNQIVYVPMGGNATFEFDPEEGVVIQSASAGILENGKLTLDGVYAPITVYLDTKRLARCDFEVLYDKSLGTVKTSLAKGTYFEGVEVSVVAKPASGTIFVGFSHGKPYNQGGEIVETSREYAYTITSESQKLYANFVKAVVGDDPALTVSVPKGRWVLIYHPNGGVDHFTPDEPYRQTTFSREFYYCPNTLPNDGMFTREGYVLLGYNTKPDGSGQFYAPGWNVVMPKGRDAISLYCIWEKETDISSFSLDVTSSGTWEIVGYNGNDTRVVIPEMYQGKDITKISAGAFKHLSGLETVILPRTIREISKNAFVGCKNFQTMYLSDSVRKAADPCVSDCPAFKTVHVMATRYPAYAGKNHGTFAVKYEKLISSDKLKLVVVSGSNTSHGMVTSLLEELMLAEGYDFEVINFGTLGEAAVTFSLEVISAFVGEGDVVIHQPEPSYDTQWGRSDFETYTMTVFEGAYDAYSYVDMRHYNNFFSVFASFNSKRGKEVTYAHYSKNYLDNNGEYITPRDQTLAVLSEKFFEYEISGGPLSLELAVDYITQYGEQLNRVYKMIGDTGALMLNSFASTAQVYLSAESQIPGGEAQKALEEKMDTTLSSTRISDVATYVFPKEWFYNSEFHLTTEGAKERTRLMAKDLLAYFCGAC